MNTTTWQKPNNVKPQDEKLNNETKSQKKNMKEGPHLRKNHYTKIDAKGLVPDNKKWPKNYHLWWMRKRKERSRGKVERDS